MKKEALLDEMKEICEQLGYTVRFERGDFTGGHCVLHEEKLIVINKRSAIERKLSVLAEFLANEDIEGVYLKPAVREFLDEKMAETDK